MVSALFVLVPLAHSPQNGGWLRPATAKPLSVTPPAWESPAVLGAVLGSGPGMERLLPRTTQSFSLLHRARAEALWRLPIPQPCAHTPLPPCPTHPRAPRPANAPLGLSSPAFWVLSIN